MSKPKRATKPNLNTRTLDALNKIVTDDWMRQMDEEKKQEDLVCNL